MKPGPSWITTASGGPTRKKEPGTRSCSLTSISPTASPASSSASVTPCRRSSCPRLSTGPALRSPWPGPVPVKLGSSTTSPSAVSSPREPTMLKAQPPSKRTGHAGACPLCACSSNEKLLLQREPVYGVYPRLSNSRSAEPPLTAPAARPPQIDPRSFLFSWISYTIHEPFTFLNTIRGTAKWRSI